MYYYDQNFSWTKKCSSKEAKDRLEKYCLKYEDEYNKIGIPMLLERCESYFDKFWAPDYVMQVYSTTDIYRDDYNFYKELLECMQSMFNIKCNVLDVASGYYPAFAEIVAKRQIELGSGKITICDPNIVMKNSPFKNMTIYKEKFQFGTNLSQYDLITSIMPCELSKELICSLLIQNKEFFIPLCGCYIGDKLLYELICELANNICNELDISGVETTYLPSRFMSKNPILYRKK